MFGRRLVAAKSRPGDKAKGPSPKRLWGIDLISAAYALAALVASRYLFGSASEQAFALVIAPLCAAFSYGLFFRKNMARLAVLILHGLGLALDALAIVYFAGAMLGMFAVADEENPFIGLLDVLIQTGVALAIFIYLQRERVKQAFQPASR